MKLKRIFLYPFLHKCPLCNKKALYSHKTGTYSCSEGAGGALYTTTCLNCDGRFKGDKDSGWIEHFQMETENYELADIKSVLENEGWENKITHVSEEDQVEIYEYLKDEYSFNLYKMFNKKAIEITARKRDIDYILSNCASAPL